MTDALRHDSTILSGQGGRIEHVIELVDSAAPAVVRLRQVAALRAALDAAEATAIVDLAGEAGWDETAEFDVVGARPVRIGADGTRLVDEFLPLEVAAAYGISATSATWLVRDVVNLHARHPHLWTAVQHGRIPLWRARQLAQHAATVDLSSDEARAVDDRIRPAIGRVAWKRLWWLYRAAVLELAPERMSVIAERSRAERFVRTGAVVDDPAVSFLSGRVDTADALGFDALLDDLAAALAARGETGGHARLRARAVGLLADPAEVVKLLSGLNTAAPLASRRPATQVYVHLTAGRLTPDGVARVEGLGPMLAGDLRHLTGGGTIRLTPVVHVGGPERVVDGYEVPAPIRAEVIARDRYEVFPSSAREARRGDLDHTDPYLPGRRGQTRAANLGPLSRRSHRAKTHGGWRLYQPQPGTFWWESPRGQTYRVGPDGTRNLTLGDPANNLAPTEQLMLWEIDRRLGQADTDVA